MSESKTQNLRRELDAELRTEPGVVLWPTINSDIPDDGRTFKIVYLDPEFIALNAEAREARLDDLWRHCGPTRRQYRNALAFVLPSDAALTGEGSVAAYDRMALPEVGEGYFSRIIFRIVPLAEATNSDPADGARRLHARVCRTLSGRLLSTLPPEQLKQIIGLGLADASGVERRYFPIRQLGRWFLSFPSLPKLESMDVLRASVVAGLSSGVFGMLHSDSLLELDNREPERAGEILWDVLRKPEEIRFDEHDYLADPSCRELAP